MDRIELRGLRALGAHGVAAAERAQAQPFEVAIDIDADLSLAASSDNLGDTIDYGAVALAATEVVRGPHAELIEHLAQRIVDAVMGCAGDRARSVSVTVRKLRPPVAVDLATAAVTITRARAGGANG